MKYAILTAKLLFWTYAAYLLVFLMTSYEPARPGFSPPFVLFVLDTINLFIHEAGHLFFKIFGMWMHIIAGSLFQVLLPLALLISPVTPGNPRERRHNVPTHKRVAACSLHRFVRIAFEARTRRPLAEIGRDTIGEVR